ncbi:HAD family phosphatase [Agreia pratensis]|uniref:HAD family hydrolase n=1 Tax=Agreia pratensis TaxID=150121 RepID=UPI00188A1B9F|nr:HAD family phosphatase [Agreia pratensis]
MFDTETAWGRALTRLFQSHQHTFNLHQHRQNIGHRADPNEDDFAALSALTDQPRDRLEGRGEKLFHEEMQSEQPFPGVREFLAWAHEQDVPVAVASSSPRRLVQPFLDSHDFSPYLQYVSYADNAVPPKPAPDVYLRALAQLGVPARQVIAVEDSSDGLRAAAAANIPCICIGPTDTVPSLSADPHLQRVYDFRAAASFLRSHLLSPLRLPPYTAFAAGIR